MNIDDLQELLQKLHSDYGIVFQMGINDLKIAV